MKDLNINKPRYFIVYVYSTDMIYIDGYEIDGAYVIMNECIEAESEDHAKELVSYDMSIDKDLLVAAELK